MNTSRKPQIDMTFGGLVEWKTDDTALVVVADEAVAIELAGWLWREVYYSINPVYRCTVTTLKIVDVDTGWAIYWPGFAERKDGGLYGRLFDPTIDQARHVRGRAARWFAERAGLKVAG